MESLTDEEREMMEIVVVRSKRYLEALRAWPQIPEVCSPGIGIFTEPRRPASPRLLSRISGTGRSSSVSSVGIMSGVFKQASETCPAGTCPGQERIMGMRVRKS